MMIKHATRAPYPIEREREKNAESEHGRQKSRDEMSPSFAASAFYISPSQFSTVTHLRRCSCFFRRHHSDKSLLQYSQYPAFSVQATNDSKSNTQLSSDPNERSVVDKLVDGVDFGELCNEFECISSPSVEATARQLARDIIELRQGNRALGTFALSVKYKDPVRSFVGREKYKRPLWATDALDKPSVAVQEMMMLSTSMLSIRWTLRGKPKSVVAIIGGDVIVKINSQFTLNQISGQVIEHQEFWDLSESSPIAQAYFWSSRSLFSTIEGGKDTGDFVKNFFTSWFSTEKESSNIFPDPSGDPTKFFQRDESFQRDVYQVGLLLAVLYFVVQFLKITL